MKQLGFVANEIESFNTLIYRGQVYHFRPQNGHLCIRRIHLGDTLSTEVCLTDRPLGGEKSSSNTVCVLDGEILHISAFSSNAQSACSITIGDGPLTKNSVHITELELSGPWDGLSQWTFMVQYAPGKVFATVHCFPKLFSLVRDGSKIRRDILDIDVPSGGYLDTVPALLAPGRLVSPGGRAVDVLDAIREIAIEEQTIEEVGRLPRPRRAAGSVLLASRFLLGFGGCSFGDLGDLWVYDLETKETSEVERRGDWHMEDCYVPMYVISNVLYLVCGWSSGNVWAIPLSVIKELIRSPAIREAFPSEAPDTQEPYLMATGAAPSVPVRSPSPADDVGAVDRPVVLHLEVLRDSTTPPARLAEMELLKLKLRLAQLSGEALELHAQLHALGAE